MKINTICAGNKVIVQQIDGLRKERSLFDQIYQQLEIEIKKKNMQLLNQIK